jgi:hypothetical protein
MMRDGLRAVISVAFDAAELFEAAISSGTSS